MEKKPPYEKKIEKSNKIPTAPPLHEEPLRGIEPGKIVCEICGKAFVSKSARDRHLKSEHEADEEKE
jgi:hypothetical protein